MFDQLELLGTSTKTTIVEFAKLLANDAVPGLISLGLIILLLVSIVIFTRRVFIQRRAIKWLLNLILIYDTPQTFTENVTIIDEEVRKRWGKNHYDNLVRAWLEYRETLVYYGEGDAAHLKNSVRPATFLNLDDLQYASGFWKIIPGLFVTIGLFLTFLGLVAALSFVNISNADPENMRQQLDQLLETAAAKFIMSLTGLLCSIIFTIVLKSLLTKLESELHGLCAHIEYLLKFISLEDISIDQLKSSREQKEHFRSIGMEMVAELGRPLREDLPKTISSSISEAMAPIIEKVTQVGTEGVGGMVEDLSTKFSSDVSAALENASDSIELAGRKIGDLAARMDQSSRNVNEEITNSISELSKTLDRLAENTSESVTSTNEAMNKGAEHFLKTMSESLEDIRINTGEGARAVSDAAADMKAAAETFKEQLSNATEQGVAIVGQQMTKAGDIATDAISGASSSVLEAFGETANNIVASSNEMSSQMSEKLLGPLDQIQKKLFQFNENFSNSTQEFRRLTEGLKNSSDATSRASESFKSAANQMSNAAQPILSTVERLGTSITSLENSTQKSSSALLNGVATIVQASEDALKNAVSILESEQEALHASLDGVQRIVERMQGQGNKMDELDEKLGVAFERYAKHVDEALKAMSNHMSKLGEEITPALDTMREVVEQAEQFIPTSRN